MSVWYGLVVALIVKHENTTASCIVSIQECIVLEKEVQKYIIHTYVFGENFVSFFSIINTDGWLRKKREAVFYIFPAIIRWFPIHFFLFLRDSRQNVKSKEW